MTRGMPLPDNHTVKADDSNTVFYCGRKMGRVRDSGRRFNGDKDIIWLALPMSTHKEDVAYSKIAAAIRCAELELEAERERALARKQCSEIANLL